MKPAILLTALAALLPAILPPPPASAQTSDPFQRQFTFKNSLPITIYPVIQAPQDTNCATGGLLRIVVNKDQEDRGLLGGESVTVTLPKMQPCKNGQGPFYDAARIYISIAPIKPYESLLNPGQKTVRYAGWDYGKDPLCRGCWIGKATDDYGLDGPQQLIEYTVISQNPADGSAFQSPNDPRGTPFIDFDVSYVDHSYLPVAMALADGGATQYMGSKLDYATFNRQSAQFVKAAGWGLFGSYLPEQWATPQQCPTSTGPPNSIIPTSFSCMVGARTDRVPSAAIMAGTLSGTSQYYWPRYVEGTSPPRACGAAANRQCSAPSAQGGAGIDPNQLCCPNDAGKTVGCCGMQNFIIGGTTFWWQNKSSFGYQNKAIDGLVARFTTWSGSHNPCAGNNAPGLAQAPVVGQNKAQFCGAFKRTVDYAWSVFQPQCQSEQGAARDRCISTAILAYDLKHSGYDPEKCKKVCPGSGCPASCVAEKLRTESVQALQRGLPWMPYGEPAKCGGCPSGNTAQCPAACIYPERASPAATIYHNDKFLHFWPDFGSVYNLNPYARFVHTGLAAPGSYSFSIDDFYGNFGGRGSGLIIEVGGAGTMPNPEPFDPYKQYRVSFGSGWHHAEVCGRQYAPPAGSEKKPFSVPLSFWNHGARLSECLVKVFPAASETGKYVAYKVTEVSYPVVDRFTGKTHPVQGLAGVYAFRGGDAPIPVDPYCKANSKGLPDSLCTGNLTFGGDNLDYVGVSNAACTADKHYDGTCGKPLVFLAIPSLP